MRAYCYLALRPDGTTVRGTISGHDQVEVDRGLLTQGLNPIRVSEVTQGSRLRKPSRQQLALFLRSLASLSESGVPLAAALSATRALEFVPSLKEAINSVSRLIDEGESLSDALDRAGIFPAAAVGMVRAGERAGQLQVALARTALHLEYEAAAVARLRRALAYPAFLLVAGFISVGVIVLMVVPRFVALLHDAGQSIPPVTRAVVLGSDASHSYAIHFLIGVALLVLGIRRWVMTPRNLALLQEALIRLPIIGRARHAWVTARIARSLGTMLQSGLPLLRALSVTSESVSDHCIRQRLERATFRVANGEGLSTSFSGEAVVLPGVIVLISIGESTGRLGDMVLKAGDMAETEADRLVDVAMTLTEPALILVFGGIVAVVAAAMFQSVYSLRPGL